MGSFSREKMMLEICMGTPSSPVRRSQTVSPSGLSDTVFDNLTPRLFSSVIDHQMSLIDGESCLSDDNYVNAVR